MIDGKVNSVVLLSPTNFYEKQHIDVSTALVKGRDHRNQSTGYRERIFWHSETSEVYQTWYRCSYSGEMGRLAAKKPEMEKYMKECVDIIVLDEVDEMVRNPGFFKQIKLICSICTKARVFFHCYTFR
jgi:hypothetical protein